MSDTREALRLESRYYLGLATTFHDPAIAIVSPNGDVLFAEATERHLQYKRAYNCEPDSTPRMADLLTAYVPADAELCIATSWGERFTSYLNRNAEAGRFQLERIASLASDVKGGLTQPSSERALLASLHLRQSGSGLGTAVGMERAFGAVRITAVRRYRHHDTHAAFGCLGSPFDKAACLVVDGMGEAGSVSLFRYADGDLRQVPASFGTVSPGFFYALLTEVSGFDAMAGEEWKLMGLAPYGRHDTELAALVRRLYRVDERGRPLRASADTVNATLGDLMASRPLDDGNGWADLARAAQDAFAELMDGFLEETRRHLSHTDLVLTGGCALNSSFNGNIVGRHGFERLHVPSAPGDDGNAVGAALLAWKEDHPSADPAIGRRPLSPYLGSTMDTAVLARISRNESRLRHVGGAILDQTAQLIAEGKIVGWVQGRAEFGPRALGNRSILADPRRLESRDLMNTKVKYRESFRPFAPSILAEQVDNWFESGQHSPYMDRTLPWRADVKHLVPAVVHKDGTGRLQTVTPDGNPRFHSLLAAFAHLTGVPILLNTSLNVMGRPIAHSTQDALMVFYTTELDALVIGDWLLVK